MSRPEPEAKVGRYWDTVARQWHADEAHWLWRRHCDAVNQALLSRWLPSRPVRLLLKTDLFDEAFSDGLYPLLADRAERVVGIDVSAVCRQLAAGRHAGLETVPADVRRLPFDDDTFDVIVSNSTLDHFASPDQILVALRQLHRTLRPGGHLLLTLDNLANPAVWLRNALPGNWLIRLGLVPYRVGAACSPRRLSDCVRQAGLEVLEMTAILHCPRVPAVAVGAALGRRTGSDTHAAYLRVLRAFEYLKRLPTRLLTAYFTAVRAIKAP